MSDEFEDVKDYKDYTKLVWGGIALVSVGVLVALGYSGRASLSNTQASVKHILVSYDAGDPAARQRALDEVSAVRERILDGEDFAKLAKEHSDDPQSGARGGYLGWADKGVYEKNFDDYVWSAPVGELSPVVQTSFGYHLIVVEERRLSDADAYDRSLEEKVKQQAPVIEIPRIEGLPQAAPAVGQ